MIIYVQFVLCKILQWTRDKSANPFLASSQTSASPARNVAILQLVAWWRHLAGLRPTTKLRGNNQSKRLKRYSEYTSCQTKYTHQAWINIGGKPSTLTNTNEHLWSFNLVPQIEKCNLAISSLRSHNERNVSMLQCCSFCRARTLHCIHAKTILSCILRPFI